MFSVRGGLHVRREARIIARILSLSETGPATFMQTPDGCRMVYGKRKRMRKIAQSCRAPSADSGVAPSALVTTWPLTGRRGGHVVTSPAPALSREICIPLSVEQGSGERYRSPFLGSEVVEATVARADSLSQHITSASSHHPLLMPFALCGTANMRCVWGEREVPTRVFPLWKPVRQRLQTCLKARRPVAGREKNARRNASLSAHLFGPSE